RRWPPCSQSSPRCYRCSGTTASCRPILAALGRLAYAIRRIVLSPRSMPHVYALLIALALTAPLVTPLARVFFGTWPHFAYDAGLRPVPERLQWPEIKSQVSAHFSSVLSTLLFDLLGFFVAYAAIVGTAYHTILWVLAFFARGS